jgi:cell division protein FtsB
MGLVSQGAVDRKVNGTVKKYKGVPARMMALRAEMKTLRADWNERAQAKAAAATS